MHRAALTPADGNQVFTLVVRVDLQISSATTVNNLARVSATGDTAGSGNNVATTRTTVTFAASKPVVVRGSTNWLLRNSTTTGGSDTTFTYGTRPLTPFLGDDVAVVRDGVWQVHHLGTGGPPHATFSFGPALNWPSVVPVAGDWNGDGIDGIGFYHLMSGPAGQWNLRQTASGGAPTQTVTYGGAGLYPVVGDWNGDGIDSLGTKVIAGEAWALSNSNTMPTTTTTFDFGVANDLPYAWR